MPAQGGVAAERNYLTEMCSGSEAGSYLRLIDFVYHSTPGFRVLKKKERLDLIDNARGGVNQGQRGWATGAPRS